MYSKHSGKGAVNAIIPAYFFYEAELVEDAWRLPCTTIILLVSALYYGKEGMVSHDMYFVGFPVMWNMVIFYLVFVVDFSSWANVMAILFFAALHFAPVKFVYPSRATRFRGLTISVTVLFILSLLLILYWYPESPDWLRYFALLCAAYYGGMAIYDTWMIKDVE
ncbi:MAG: hypothetical protein AAFP19_19440 [Bacteroidota bacterium]